MVTMSMNLSVSLRESEHLANHRRRDYARLIPPSVIRQMLGFPEEDTDKFIDIVHMITESVDLSEEERIEQFEPIEAYFVARSKTTRPIPVTTSPRFC